ncbi:MAG: sugar phosphate isomerase/epimerase [Bryobacteraceae bacterium]|nr:sugar phosphate isomerase/epimerase [Bryobacterales bacterium]NUN00730.1 sugar phosphate isomerase/epimerase [Bryobacteraceae bacterium]
MKFGVNMFIWTAEFGQSDLRLLPTIKERGFDGIEIPIFNPTTFPAAQIRRALQENGLETTICSVIPNGLGVIADDANVRAQTIAHLEASIARAAEVGARVFAGPLYSPVGYLPGRRRTPDEWKRAVEGFQTLGPALAQHNVTIAIEPLNRFETYFLNTAADAVALVREIGHPNVGLLVDTFHANIEEKSIADAYRTAGSYLKHVHTCENDRGTPGSGHVEWQDVFQALREVEYDGWLTIESFGFAIGGLSAAASIWRDLARTPADIAFEGLAFLKQNTAKFA